ncbi:hypothetical protein [Frigoribacterium sp. NPDC087798]|uniref:hypothetical protein n=1 Tax=Frigoribacterium sp. NPDC087798 TaxID=3363993 RepID=UPI00381EA9FD
MNRRFRRASRAVARMLRVERVYDRGLRSARVAAERRRDSRWQAVIGEFLQTGVSVSSSGAWGRPDSAGIPMVMCLWNRPDRLPHVLDMLAALDAERPVRLLLWNNNAADAARYAEAVRGAATGSLVSVDLVQSPVNIGGLARFVAARLLWNAGYRGPVVMLDDDQDVSSRFVTDLLADYESRSVVSWWAFSQHGSYWARAEIAPGSPADHAGTGGTVYDCELVSDDAFFARLPRRFAFLEDQWMSFFAHAKGWRVVKARTDISLVSEELNQYHALKPLKDVFYHFQRQVGPAYVVGSVRRSGWGDGRLRSGGAAPSRAS